MSSSSLAVPFLLPLLWMASLCGQDAKPRLEPDPEQVVASRLEGRWAVDVALSDRLGGKVVAKTLAFRVDAGVIDKVPAEIGKALAKARIYLAGVLTMLDKEHPFLLIELRGNTQVLWFRERNGDPMGDTESFIVMLAKAADRANDLLFVGGDFNNQPFTAFERIIEGAKANDGPLEATVREMMRMLVAKEHVEFIKTFAIPSELEEIVKREGSLQALASQFGKRKAGQLLTALKRTPEMKPKMSEDGNEAVYDFDGDSPRIRFVRIDGRWYLGN